MLRNFVNRHDARAIVDKLRSDGVATLFRRFGKRRAARVADAWADAPDDDQWWVIDAVRRRWGEKISGDADVDVPRYVCERYLRGRIGLDALMVGCGSGHSVPRWAATGVFRRIDAFDVAPGQVARAQACAAEHALDGLVHVRLADAATVDLGDGSYDVIVAEQALHHLSPLASILARLARALRSGGLLVVDDFVGPTRHQWMPRQLEAANALLAQLPQACRRLRSGHVKDQVVRPSIARMILSDPSEAVESSRILPLLHESFEVLDVRGYGGTLLEPVLSGIAHNFVGSDADTQRLLAMCFAVEDAMLATGELTHDFVVVVARPRACGA